MPLQNRVTPFGEVIATPERGIFMGNRGRIHNPQRVLKGRHWERKAWIICVLDFKGRHREVMSPNSYTELFFLDEVTAFAAGHRPCAECRRPDANRFKDLWFDANSESANGRSGTMPRMDALLHSERLTGDGALRRWEASLSSLPDGVMVALENSNEAFLFWQGDLCRWTPGGYIERREIASESVVTVLTPPSIARVLTAGYRPVVHPSVDVLGDGPSVD